MIDSYGSRRMVSTICTMAMALDDGKHQLYYGYGYGTRMMVSISCRGMKCEESVTAALSLPHTAQRDSLQGIHESILLVARCTVKSSTVTHIQAHLPPLPIRARALAQADQLCNPLHTQHP
eukprot:1159580-Pelagomonas_calceolata.AAC.2